MKKLILILLLFGFSAVGEEFSRTGLEGIAKDGLKISVNGETFVPTFDVKAIRNQVELKLRPAGIRVNNRAGNFIYVTAQPVLTNKRTDNFGDRILAYALRVKAYRRDVTFEANNKQYRCSAAVWDRGGIASQNKLRDAINEFMDQFLLDYLKANPKKKED